MSQSTLFSAPKPPREIPQQMRKPAVPHGEPDKRGRLWWQRFADEVDELPKDAQAVLLEMILEWPADRLISVEALIHRWLRAQGLDRDNFAEAYGK